MRTIALVIAVALVTAGSSTAAFIVTSKNIKNGTIQLIDMSAKAKKALRGRRGPRGPQGPQGAQGLQGSQGPKGGLDLSKVSYASEIGFVPAQGRATVAATCPSGQKVLGGGFNIVGTPTNLNVLQSYPSGDRTWNVTIEDLSSTPVVGGSFFAYAVCASP
jgi:hypothetical protein